MGEGLRAEKHSGSVIVGIVEKFLTGPLSILVILLAAALMAPVGIAARDRHQIGGHTTKDRQRRDDDDESGAE